MAVSTPNWVISYSKHVRGRILADRCQMKCHGSLVLFSEISNSKVWGYLTSCLSLCSLRLGWYTSGECEIFIILCAMIWLGMITCFSIYCLQFQVVASLVYLHNTYKNSFREPFHQCVFSRYLGNPFHFLWKIKEHEHFYKICKEAEKLALMAGWLFDMGLQIRREGHGGEEVRGENGLDGARRKTDYSPS